MADLEKGTEGSEPVAHSDDSQELREREENGSPGEEDGQDHPKGAAMEQAHSRKARSKAAWLLGALGLGMATGWWGHDFQAAQAKDEKAAAVQGKGSDATGPCRAWVDTICQQMGELAYECTHARAASPLLSDSACLLAQESVLAKIDGIQAERVECSELTTRFCSDLGPEGKGCELARAKEPTFSIKDCQDMKKNYPRVLAQIVERQEKGTLPNPPRGSRPSLEIATPN